MPSSIPSGPSGLVDNWFIKIKDKLHKALNISVIDIERYFMLFDCWKCKLLVYNIANNSVGVTTMGLLGKCLVFPVTTNEPSFESATS